MNFIERTVENTKRDHRERLPLSLFAYGLLAVSIAAFALHATAILAVAAVVGIVVYVLIYRQ